MSDNDRREEEPRKSARVPPGDAPDMDEEEEAALDCAAERVAEIRRAALEAGEEPPHNDLRLPRKKKPKE